MAVIAGASSVPALSGAVVRRLAEGLERVDSVEMAISASNRASAGMSVAAAILSYVGRPVRLWRGKRWETTHGWQELRREDFAAGGEALRRRLVAIADVPDHAIVAERLPGRPAVTFRAGTELDFQMLTLWLMSWPVRWGWLESLTQASRWLMPLYRMTLGFGGDRSAMHVTVRGGRTERRWTLIASEGDGPEIPVLAAELIADDLLAGRVAPGARHAWEALTLARFEPLFAALSIRHETVERQLPDPLYARLMGSRFAALAPMVRAMHESDAAAGEGIVERGGNPLAGPLAAMMGMPPAGRYPLHVGFAERGGAETWTRDFGGHRFRSTLSARDGLAIERFGPLRFGFDLPSDGKGLRMAFRCWSLFGVPLPRFLGPRIAAREWEEEGRFRFAVDVAVPLVGRVIRYSGWLLPLEETAQPEPERRAG